MTCKIKLVCSKQKVCTENFQDITFLLRIYYSVTNYYYSIAQNLHYKIAPSKGHLLVEKRTIMAIWLRSYFF